MFDSLSVTLKQTSKLPFFKKYWNELKSRKLTFPAVLIIIYAMAIDFSMDIAFNAAFAMSTTPNKESCFAPIPEPAGSIVATQVPSFIQNTLFFIAFPVMGWLADSVIGRIRSVNLSLRLTWFGSLLQMISYCIQYGMCGLPVSIAKYGLSSIALIVIVIGNAGFYSNMLAYGLDQMQDSSNSQVRAFVHWLVWAMFVGFFTDYLAFLNSTIYSPYLLQISAIVIFIVITIAVTLNELFQLEMGRNCASKNGNNPYKLVYDVLKYAIQHKSPEKRSALTYWENDIPKRIDLGKNRYGGPFKDEEPEDVKTFFHIVAVFLSFFGFYIPYYVVVNGVFPYIDQMEDASTTLGGYGGLIVYKILDQQVFYIIPIFELIIVPSFPKIEYFFTNPLQGLNATYIFLCIGVILIFTINTIAHLITKQTLSCYDTEHSLSLQFGYFAIPLFFTGLADFMSYLFILELICSQAPANMSGMLLGVFWFIRGFYLNIGALLQLPFFFPEVHLDALGKLTCSFWVLLLQAVICVIGVIVNLMVGKYYKRRQRDEGYHATEIITDYTSKVINRSYFNNSSATSSREVFSIVTL